EGESAQRVAPDTGEQQARAPQREREVLTLGRAPDRGADRRELGCRRLVALDQLVGLGPARATVAGELGETIPLRTVSGGVGVEIHLLEYYSWRQIPTRTGSTPSPRTMRCSPAKRSPSTCARRASPCAPGAP